MHTPDEAIEELEFVTKQLGAKVCMFGSGVRRPIPHAKGADRRRRPLCPGLRSARPRQRVRLRPAVAEVPRARHRADLPHRRPQLWRAQQPDQLHLQPHRPFRRGRPRRRQGAVPRRRDPALPRSALRVPRRRRRLGLPAVRRPDRALGAARRQGRWQNMDPTKLDRTLLRELVDKYGYADIAAELDRRDGWPDRRGLRSPAAMPPRRLSSAARSPGSRTGSTSTPRRTTSAARPTTG